MRFSPPVLLAYQQEQRSFPFVRKSKFPELKTLEMNTMSLTPFHKGLKVPVLNLPKHAKGGTGYIDGLKSKDMSAPVMKGTDEKGRPFIALKYTSCTLDSEGVKDNKKKEVLVLFQRYSDRNDIWVCGGHHCRRHIFQSALTKLAAVTVKELIKTKAAVGLNCSYADQDKLVSYSL